jgi:hypothetical protein
MNSISKIVNDILAEVKTAKLTDLAARQIVKEASAHPTARTTLGEGLQKLAVELRSGSTDVTVDDVKAFLDGVANAR